MDIRHLLILQKSMQKKQGFETLSSMKENPGPCKKGWGAAPFVTLLMYHLYFTEFVFKHRIEKDGD
jgi:hypothetical protein